MVASSLAHTGADGAAPSISGTAVCDAPAVGGRAADFYRGVVEGMTCGVLTIDRQGIITTLNEHARVILELDEGDAVGRHCREALARSNRLSEILLESFGMSSPPSRAELEIRSRDTTRRSIGFSVSMIASADGASVIGAALFFKDLTPVEEQEERERLRDRLAALGEMAAQMAHEIRNPLTSIEVSAALLRRRLTNKGEKTDLLEKISGEASRIESTIANCLEYARPLVACRKPTHPVELLDEAVEVAALSKGSQGVTVQRDYARDLPMILCDRVLVKECLVNILNNAFEVMGSEGTLTVSARIVPAALVVERPSERARRSAADGGGSGPRSYLAIRVTDTGPGVPAELRDRIFYPFFTTKSTGSGIGLARARKVVEAHGGWLDVESEAGSGATFIVKMPVIS